MRRCGVVVLAFALGSTAAAATPPLKPGDHIGTMLVTNGRPTETVQRLTDHCNPVITKAGVYHRRCTIPLKQQLWIGYGEFAKTLKELDALWVDGRWRLVLDGREVDLKAFGAIQYHPSSFAPVGGGSAYIREWKVRLVEPTPGRHTVRYITTYKRDGSVIDVTFTITLVRG
jgi:hypothetical protein